MQRTTSGSKNEFKRMERQRKFERELLKKHPNPVVDGLEDDYLARHERLTRGGAPTAQDCLSRLLRLMTRKIAEPEDELDVDTYLELSTFTPWEQYGDRLTGAIAACRAFVLHVENDGNDQPVIVVIGTLNGGNYVFRIPEHQTGSPWAHFARAFPKVARILENKTYLKLTSTYDATKKLLRPVCNAEDIVDAALLDEVDEEIKGGVRHERLRTQIMVWKTLGRQSGPVWIDDWRYVKGRAQYPHPRHPDVLLDWSGARRTGHLSPGQKRYVRQAVQSAGIRAASQTLVSFSEPRHSEEVLAMMKQCLSPRTQSSTSLTIQDVRMVVQEVEREEKRGDNQPPSRRVEVDRERKREAKDDEMDESGNKKRVHVTMDCGPCTKQTGAVKKTSGGFHNNNANVFENPLQLLEEYDAHVQQSKRQSINKARAEFKATNGDKFKDDFLGKNCCHRCGSDKKHDDPMECVVEYYLKYKKLPRQCTVPCIYCSSPRHATDACVFIHIRCKKCRRRGHMQHECHLRTPLEWLLVYLDCCHLGKLTRENLDGPLGGRFGFGDVTGINIPPAVWEYIAQKKESLKRTRKRGEQGIGFAGQSRESLVGWTLLTQELQALANEKAKFLDEKRRFYEEKKAWKEGRSVDEDDEDGLLL